MQRYSKGVIYAIITALFWGVLAVALKVAVNKVDPVTIVWFRFTLAFIPLFIWSFVKQPSELQILIKPPFLLVIAALALSWNYLAFNLGVKYTSPGNAQLFVQTGQILLALAGIVFFKERFNKMQLAGFVLAIVGLLLFYNQQIGHFSANAGEYRLGIFIILSGAFTWTVYAVIQKKLVVRFSALSLNLFLFGLPMLLYIPFVNFSQLTELNWKWWLLMAFLGFNTLVAYTTLALSLRHLAASKASIILIMNPVITFALMALLAWLEVTWIQPERMSFLSIIGAIVLLAGALLVIRKPRKNV
jgi:drug/metabolite transporter (DMT)-like permease